METLVYIYDESGAPIGFRYRTPSYAEGVFDNYYYEKNMQGDIVAVYNADGAKLVGYSYTAWGECNTEYYNSATLTSVTKNPFTYRGYYYDIDLGLYYLQSRYYDSKVCRFISPDEIGYLGANADFSSYNLYAYCSNNPVMYTDPSGHFGIIAAALIGLAVGFVATVVSDFLDDESVFNGSVGVGDYIGNSLITAGVAALGAWAAPIVANAMTPALATSTGEIIVSGVAAAAVSVVGSATVMFAKQSKRSHKEMADDKPNWVNRDMIDYSKSAQENTRNILDNKYGSGNWSKGPTTEYNKILKWIVRKIFYGK